MSRREEMIYAQMVAEDQRQTAARRAIDPKAAAIVTEPIETVFFFPTKDDVAIARAWVKWRGIPAGNHPLTAALRHVLDGAAVPAATLDLIRSLKDALNELKVVTDRPRGGDD